jgi:hypothetical protein
VLIRADSGGGTHGFLHWLTAKSRRLHYSVSMTVTEDMQNAILKVPADSWTPAYLGLWPHGCSRRARYRAVWALIDTTGAQPTGYSTRGMVRSAWAVNTKKNLYN